MWTGVVGVALRCGHAESRRSKPAHEIPGTHLHNVKAPESGVEICRNIVVIPIEAAFRNARSPRNGVEFVE